MKENQTPDRQKSRLLVSYAAELWQLLTKPSAYVRGPVQRRTARLLSSFLLIVIGLFVLFHTANLIAFPGYSIPPSAAAGYLLLASAYILSRTRVHRLAAILLVSSFYIVSLSQVIGNAASSPILVLTYPIPGLLLGSILFSYPATVVLAVLHLVGLLLMPILAPTAIPGFEAISVPFGVNLMTAVLVLIAMRHRDRVAKIRRAQLRETENRFRELAANVREVFWIFDWNRAKVLYVSPAYEDVWGRSTQALLDDYGEWGRSIHPDDRQDAAESFQQIAETGGGGEREYRIVKPDGSVRWILDQGFAVYGEDGAVQRVVGFAEDITDRKLAEQQIERLARFPSENPSPVLRVDDGGTILYANDASALLLDCWATQVGGRLPHSLTAALQDALAAAQAQTVHVGCEESIYSLDLAPIVEEGYVNVYGRDVTERTQAEVALRESEARYRGLFEYSPVALWEEDFTEVKKHLDSLRAEGVSDLGTYLDEHPAETMHCFSLIKVHDVNQAALNLYRAQSKQDLRNVLEVIVPDESVGSFTQVLAAFADGETFFESEGPQFTLTGDLIHQHGNTAILPGYEETWSNVLVSIVDITERKRVEEEREMLIAELEAKNAELERFTYTVSHDLKSPLITIKGFLGFLEQDLVAGDRERMQDDLARISSAAERMEQLLNELLELSRIGRIANPPEDVDLAELAHETVSMVAGRLDERGVEVQISPDLPMIHVDRARLREVLENLVDNAVKFMGDQPHPQVEIGVRRDGEDRVFYVRDNGMGIAPRFQDKVFDLFEKLDASSEGSGVGLAIVKRIVKVHGGQVWIESEGVGQGCTFCFTLPWEADSTREREQGGAGGER